MKKINRKFSATNFQNSWTAEQMNRHRRKSLTRLWHIIIRVQVEDGEILTALVASGSKLNPTKNKKWTDIPLVELLALNEGTEILVQLLILLEIEDFIVQVDSLVVIHQLHKASLHSPKVFQTFVANCLQKNLSSLEVSPVIHVSSDLNPAHINCKVMDAHSTPAYVASIR